MIYPQLLLTYLVLPSGKALSKVEKVQGEKRDLSLFSQKRNVFGISACSPESDNLMRTGIRKKYMGGSP